MVFVLLEIGACKYSKVGLMTWSKTQFSEVILYPSDITFVDLYTEFLAKNYKSVRKCAPR